MSALRPRARGVFVDVSAAVSVALAIGVQGHIALDLLLSMSSGINAAMKKLHTEDQ